MPTRREGADVVTVALPGDFGKPRPALVVQADQFEQAGTVTVVLVTSLLADAPLLRPTVDRSPANGLRKRSQVMVDKAMTVRRDKIGAVVGHLEADTMLAVTRSLALYSGLREKSCAALTPAAARGGGSPRR